MIKRRIVPLNDVQCAHCANKYRSKLATFEAGIVIDVDETGSQNLLGKSRRDGESICTACAKAESLADITGASDRMMRVAVETDRQEAVRLPEGLIWGPTGCVTGGLDK